MALSADGEGSPGAGGGPGRLQAGHQTVSTCAVSEPAWGPSRGGGGPEAAQGREDPPGGMRHPALFLIRLKPFSGQTPMLSSTHMCRRTTRWRLRVPYKTYKERLRAHGLGPRLPPAPPPLPLAAPSSLEEHLWALTLGGGRRGCGSLGDREGALFRPHPTLTQAGH